MRRVMLAILVFVILVSGTATAQGRYWAGVSAGWPGVALHFGLDNVTPDLSVRINAGYAYGGTIGFALGLDAMYDLDINTGSAPLYPYIGGGLGLGLGSRDFALAVNLFIGGEFRLVDVGLPQGGVFLEVGPAIRVIPNFDPNVLGRLGFNLHF